MKTTQLREVLHELYALDPTLRAQEEELIPILEKLLKHKPDTEPDPAFVQKLRVLLQDKAAEPKATRVSFFSFFTMPTFNYAITGAVLGAIITGPVVYGIMQSGGIASFPTDGTREQALFSYSVEETAAGAFGELATQQTVDAYGRGGGAPAMDTANNPRPQSGGGGDTSMMIDQKMIVSPEMTEYTLVFDAAAIPALTAEQVDVFKRQKGTSSADISTILGSFNTGLMDLSSFKGAKTDMLSFYQDAPYGYMVTVSFRDGSISINSNWERWPHPESQCQDEACFKRFRLQIGDIPSDETLIGIANAFMSEHNIDLAQYGDPEVDTLWRTSYEAMENKADYYIPEQIRVIYPQLVDGKPVYDEGGTKTGISVTVHAREKKVTDLWGIMDQKYLKSGYAGVTDVAQVSSYLESFGKIPTDWMPEGTTIKKTEITLGAPEMGFVKMYTYANNVSEELIVPALIFPVTNVPAGTYFYRNTVTVPLAADLLKNMNQITDPRPMPLMMEDAARAEEVALPKHGGEGQE